MKKLKLELEGEEMLTKDQMKNIRGGDEFCDYGINPCIFGSPNEGCNTYICYIDYWHGCNNNTAIVKAVNYPNMLMSSVYTGDCTLM